MLFEVLGRHSSLPGNSSQLVVPPVLASEYTIALQASTSYIHAVVISAGLKGPQVDQVNGGNDSRASAYSRLVGSKLVTACNA